MGMMTRRNVKRRAVQKTALVISKPNQDDFSQYMNAPVESNEVAYTKTEINRMAIAELKEVAKVNGIDGADEMTGADLKKVLIGKFGL